MDDQHLLDEFLRAAEKLGVEVRIEAFETPATTGGGLCVLRGGQLVLLDEGAPLSNRVLALARALARLESETVYMVPEARELVEAQRVEATIPKGRPRETQGVKGSRLATQ
ncbi:MAG: hypothetical protein ACE5JD_14065 [Candidatus Methylomirabilia bacterium]